MGLNALLKSAQNESVGSMNYTQAFQQLGHAIILGTLLMLLTIWIGRRTAKFQNKGKNKSESTNNERLQGAINVLFFCFGMTGIMILVDDNIARAFAIGAAIALVRFRIKMGNSLLSTAFLFSVVIGMACGVNNLPIAWSIALMYGLVTIMVSIGLAWRTPPDDKSTAPDLLPGQIYRDEKGNWNCYFPRYTATIDGISGDMIGLQVKEETLIDSLKTQFPSITNSAGDGSVVEFDSPCAGRSALYAANRERKLWWHFFSDSIILECEAASNDASEVTLLLTRYSSALSKPYAAMHRHLSEVIRKSNAITGETGVSSVTRGGTQVVFIAPDLRPIGQESVKKGHGITIAGKSGTRWAAEIQIGLTTPMVSIPDMD